MCVHVCACVCVCQVGLASLLEDMKMYAEAEAAWIDTFENGIKVSGPDSTPAVCGLRHLYGLYRQQKRTRDALRLKNRAVKLGCDVSSL